MSAASQKPELLTGSRSSPPPGGPTCPLCRSTTGVKMTHPKPPYIATPRIWDAHQVAARHGKGQAWFNQRRPELEAARSPGYEALSRGRDGDGVEAWPEDAEFLASGRSFETILSDLLLGYLEMRGFTHEISDVRNIEGGPPWLEFGVEAQ